MEAIALLGRLLGLSFVSGINLYATVAVVGLSIKYHLVSYFPTELQVLAHDGIIGLALTLYVLEFFADKIPGLDTAWDLIHTIIRPLGGAFIAFLNVANGSPAAEVMAFMVGMFLAGIAHATKAGTRLMVQMSPEPLSNAILSLGEDVMVISFSFVAMKYPFVSFFLVVFCFVITWFLLPLLFRLFLMTVKLIWWRLTRRFFSLDDFSHVPRKWESLWNKIKDSEEKAMWSSPVFVRSLPSVRRFVSGWLVVSDKGVYFFCRRWGRKKTLFRRGVGFRWKWERSYLFARCCFLFDSGDTWYFCFHSGAENFFRARLFNYEMRNS